MKIYIDICTQFILKPFQDAYSSTSQKVLVFYLMMHRLSVSKKKKINNKSWMSEDSSGQLKSDFMSQVYFLTVRLIFVPCIHLWLEPEQEL